MSHKAKEHLQELFDDWPGYLLPLNVTQKVYVTKWAERILKDK